MGEGAAVSHRDSGRASPRRREVARANEGAGDARALSERYVVERLIGEGAHGRVYEARDLVLGRSVALKSFVASPADDGFLREISAVFELAHPAIVPCESVFMQDGSRYLVYELMELGSLRDRINRGADVVATLELLREAARGVAYAHKRNVLHRDLKPENILVARRGGALVAKVTDFGVSALGIDAATRSNSGSPAYMAPEQFYDAYDSRVDVYALGVVLYEILCGHRPFQGTPAQIMLAHLERSVPIPESLPPGARALLQRALAKKPEERLGSVDELIHELDAVLREERALLDRERWPLLVPDADSLVLTSSALFLRTGSHVTRHGPRGDRLDVLANVDDIVGAGEFVAIRRGDEVALYGAHGLVRALRVPRASSLVLSRRGELAVIADGKLRSIGQRSEQGSTVLGRDVVAACFVGEGSELALAIEEDNKPRLVLAGTRLSLPEPVGRLWSSLDGSYVLAESRTTETLFRASNEGVVSVFPPARVSACDGVNAYALLGDGALWMCHLETLCAATVRLTHPLKAVAADAGMLAWISDEGSVDRMQLWGRVE